MILKEFPDVIFGVDYEKKCILLYALYIALFFGLLAVR